MKKRFFHNKPAGMGLGFIVLMLLFCVVGPFISPYGEYEIFYINHETGKELRMGESDVGESYVRVNVKASVSYGHWLGTDADGRDVLTRLMYGGRISLLSGIVVITIEMFLGIFLGGAAGYYGKAVDMVIMRLAEVFDSIPFIPLMLIISAAMLTSGVLPQHKIFWTMGVMGGLNWAKIARQVRGQILSLREAEYMQAAKAAGIRTFGIIVRHLIPNVMPIIILIATLDIGNVILAESVLSYLGIGVAWPYASWGNMMDSVNNLIILEHYMNIWLPPGICILLTVMAFNLIGEGIRDALEPKEYKAVRQRKVHESEYITKMENPDHIIEFHHLKTFFQTETGTVKAVDDVSFGIPRGKTVGVAGESGCGKSVAGLTVMRLLRGQTVEGEIRYHQRSTGRVLDLTKAGIKELERIRGNEVSMIFQESMTALNPVFTIGNQLCECISLHNPGISRKDAKKKALEMLKTVGIVRDGILDSYPHELSGGMLQRVVIAMSLSCEPELVIADEPTTALDVTIQAQILELLRDIKEKMQLSVMLITHDLEVIAKMSDYVVVMYAGRVVEQGTVSEIFHNPVHPYTIGLMKAGLLQNEPGRRLYSIPGNIPDPRNLPKHCHYKSRCRFLRDACSEDYPQSVDLTKTHKVCCHLYNPDGLKAGGKQNGL